MNGGVDGLRTCAQRESAAFEKVQMCWWSGSNAAGGCGHRQNTDQQLVALW